MERSILRGLAVFRWAAWAGMAAPLLVGHRDLRRPWLAWGLVGLALVVTAALTLLLDRDPALLLRPGPVLAELAVGLALVVCDGVAYREGHAISTQQSLGVAWPLFGVLSAGLAFGAVGGAAAGAVMGGSRLLGTVLNGVSLDDFTGGRWASPARTVVVYPLAGAMVGYVTGLLRRAERQVSEARAREDVARRLHDGVLQTLAVVERRTDDPALARLAKEQERDLREWLFGTAPA